MIHQANKVEVPLLSDYFEGGIMESAIYILTMAILFYLFYKLFQGFMNRKKIDSRKSILNIIRGLLTIILFLATLSRVTMFEGIARTIFASSGIIAIVVGIAAQDTIGNLMSGIMVIAFKPFVVGDLIKINGEQLIGFVEDITLRHTIIRTYENNRIIVPNTEINRATIENANLVESIKGNYFLVPISYRSDLDQVTKIIKEEVMKHPNFIDSRSELEKSNGVDPVHVHCIEFAQNNLVLRCVINSKDSFQGFEMLSDLRFSIKKRFEEEGIEIPYNHTYDAER